VIACDSACCAASCGVRLGRTKRRSGCDGPGPGPGEPCEALHGLGLQSGVDDGVLPAGVEKRSDDIKVAMLHASPNSFCSCVCVCVCVCARARVRKFALVYMFVFVFVRVCVCRRVV